MCSTCHPDRTGETWEEFLATYRLKNICNDGRGWRVDSASGATYHVGSYVPKSQNPNAPLFVMRCDCPARKRCRHIDAVMQMRYAEEFAAACGGDTDGMDILERTE